LIQVPLEIAAKSGAPLAKPIYGAMGQILLRAGTILDKRYIPKLKYLGIHNVYINGGKVDTDEPISQEIRHRAAMVLKDISQGENINSVSIADVVNNILDDILGLRGIIESILNISSYDGYTFMHSIDVCALTMSVGFQLGYQRPSLLEMGIGALLHDIGKLKISPHIINKPEKLNDDEFAEVMKHPKIGYETIKDHKQVSERSAHMVLEHHERFDGTGYPHKKGKQNIHRFSSICGIVDMYSAMITKRCYREAYPPHEVYEMIMGMGDSSFEFKVVQAFSKCILPYPKGTIVLLSNNMVAQVVSNDTGHPYLPTVIMLEPGNDKKNNLVEAKLTIKHVVKPEEMEDLINNNEVEI
jgi:HD-GYP domain-containing protein (c-di-GMP phosphodiesterase class II)